MAITEIWVQLPRCRLAASLSSHVESLWAPKSGAIGTPIRSVLDLNYYCVCLCRRIIMHISRYQPLAGTRELIFSHGVIHTLTYKKAGRSPHFSTIFSSILPSFSSHFLLNVNVPFSFTTDRLSSILIYLRGTNDTPIRCIAIWKTDRRRQRGNRDR